MTALLNVTSEGIGKIERWMLILLASAVTLLILLNVITRSLNFAIFWVDELAIYSMVWLVMVGASVTIQKRKGICVTILEGVISMRLWRAFLLIVDIVILLFAITLIWLSWIWYDPLTLALLAFDKDAFSASTFNYIYDEPTLTIGVPKFLVWLIMPFTAITMTIHAANNLTSWLTSGLEN